MDVRELLEHELGGSARSPRIRVVRFLEFAALPVTKSSLATEAADFTAACERAERKGNRAHELLNSPECLPDPALVREWAKDYEIAKGKK